MTRSDIHLGLFLQIITSLYTFLDMKEKEPIAQSSGYLSYFYGIVHKGKLSFDTLPVDGTTKTELTLNI